MDAITAAKRREHASNGIMSDALGAMTCAYTSAREDAKTYKGMVDSRQRESEDFLREILNALYAQDETEARGLTEEKLSRT